MADAADRDIRLARHFRQERREFGRIALPPKTQDGGLKAALQNFCETIENQVGEFLAVVQEADSQTLERFWPLGKLTDWRVGFSDGR